VTHHMEDVEDCRRLLLEHYQTYRCYANTSYTSHIRFYLTMVYY